MAIQQGALIQASDFIPTQILAYGVATSSWIIGTKIGRLVIVDFNMTVNGTWKAQNTYLDLSVLTAGYNGGWQYSWFQLPSDCMIPAGYRPSRLVISAVGDHEQYAPNLPAVVAIAPSGYMYYGKNSNSGTGNDVSYYGQVIYTF